MLANNASILPMIRFFQLTLSRLGETTILKIQFTEIPPPTRLCSFTSSSLQTIVLITIPLWIDNNMATISIIWGASQDCLANMFESHFTSTKTSFIIFQVKLGGGNSNMLYIHPEPWGNDPILTNKWSKGVGSTTLGNP